MVSDTLTQAFLTEAEVKMPAKLKPVLRELNNLAKFVNNAEGGSPTFRIFSSHNEAYMNDVNNASIYIMGPLNAPESLHLLVASDSDGFSICEHQTREHIASSLTQDQLLETVRQQIEKKMPNLATRVRATVSSKSQLTAEAT